MPAKISVLLPSRSSVNGINAFKRSINSLINKVKNLDNIELLIKLDSDEPKLDEYIEFIENSKKSGVTIIHIINSRSNGYKSLHEHYVNLMLISSEETMMYFVLCDDTEIVQDNWDEVLINKANSYHSDMFVIHPTYIEDLKGKSTHDCMQCAEPFPIWSREWIHTQGFFGYSFSTDGWTSITENNLFQKYGIDHRIKLDAPFITRHGNSENDGVGSERWNGVRRETIKLHLSKKIDDLLQANTDKLASRITNGKGLANSLKDKYVENLKETLLNLYDQNMLTNIKFGNIASILAAKDEEISRKTRELQALRGQDGFEYNAENQQSALDFLYISSNKKLMKNQIKSRLKQKNYKGVKYKIRYTLARFLLSNARKILK